MKNPPSSFLSATGWIPVWRRNFLVWKKLALPAIMGNLADPMIYILGLGYGLGALLPPINGQPYIAFLAAGMICSSTMNTATFESLYSAFTRMHAQKTWEAILNTPLGLNDVLLGELIWSATKSLFSGIAILMVVFLMGLSQGGGLIFLALPAIMLTGLAFAAMALVWNALSPSYDFFMYYITLFITPATLISGVFFPTDQLPAWLSTIGSCLPLAQGVLLIRPLLNGQIPDNVLLHTSFLILTTILSFMAALFFTRRRLLK